MLIHGIDVILYNETVTGYDPFGNELKELIPEVVSNVVVSQPNSDEIVSSTSLHGKEATYILFIPKGDKHHWEDRTVEFFGEKWKTFGFATEFIDDLCPLAWNKRIMVARYG